MKKSLNEVGIANELKSGSVFFSRKEKRTSDSQEANLPGGQEVRRSTSQEVKRLGGQEVRRLASQEAKRSGGQEVGQSSSIPDITLGWHEEMVWKGSHLYTERERNLFDEIVLKLREQHGLDVHKRVVARAALRLLADDFRRRGEASFIVSLLLDKIKQWLENITSQEARRSGGQPPKQPAS